jgi:hypothetical protein
MSVQNFKLTKLRSITTKVPKYYIIINTSYDIMSLPNVSRHRHRHHHHHHHTHQSDDCADILAAAMSMRTHTKDMLFLNQWMEESTKTNESISTSINRNRNEHDKAAIEVFMQSFAVLTSTRLELTRQLGAHCSRLQNTDHQHWSATSKLYNKILNQNKRMRQRIVALEHRLTENQTSHVAESKKQNQLRERLITRVTDAELEADQLRAELKTALHLGKQSVKERDRLEQILEERLGGGSRGAGGGSDESSSEYLTALDRSKRDVSMLQKLGDVVLDFTSERDRREKLCNEMSSLVSRLGVAVGFDDTRFDATAIFVEEEKESKQNNTTRSLMLPTTTTQKQLNSNSTTALDDATRFLRATQQKTLGIQKRDVAVQAFTSTLRFDHSVSRMYGGMSSRRQAMWLSTSISSKTEILRLVVSFIHFGPPVLGMSEADQSIKAGNTSSKRLPVGITKGERRDVFNENGVRYVHGVGLDNDCVGADDDGDIESAMLARNRLISNNIAAAAAELENNAAAAAAAAATSPPPPRKARTIDVNKLPILLRAQINDRNVHGRPWSISAPYDVLSTVIEIYFEYVQELMQTRRAKRQQQQQQQPSRQEVNESVASTTSGTVIPTESSTVHSSSFNQSSSTSSRQGPAGLGLAPAPLLIYVLKRYQRNMNGVRSLAEYHAVQFFMNVLHYYKELTLRVDHDNEVRLLGEMKSGSNSNPGSGDESDGSKKKKNKNNGKNKSNNTRPSPLKRRQEKALEEAKKKQEQKDVRRLGLFCRLTGLIGLSSAFSSGATRFVLAGLYEACDFDPSISIDTLRTELKNSLHGAQHTANSSGSNGNSSGGGSGNGSNGSGKNRIRSSSGSSPANGQVFVDRGVVTKVIGKLVSGMLHKASSSLNFLTLMMPFDFTELTLHGRSGISFDSLLFGFSEVWELVETRRKEILSEAVRMVRLGMKENPPQIDESEDEDESEDDEETTTDAGETTGAEDTDAGDEMSAGDEMDDGEGIQTENDCDSKKAVIFADESINIYIVDEEERRSQDRKDAAMLELIPTQDIYRALQWVITGVDPLAVEPTMREDEKKKSAIIDGLEKTTEKEEKQHEEQHEAKKSEGKEGSQVHVPQESDGIGGKDGMEGEKALLRQSVYVPSTPLIPAAMTPAHDHLIDGVIEDVDSLVGSVDYWTSLVRAPGGPISKARARVYDRLHRRKWDDDDETTTCNDPGVDPAALMTVEDIDELLHWRETSCGIDDDSLAALILGRGGGVRVTIHHPCVAHDVTFG